MAKHALNIQRNVETNEFSCYYKIRLYLRLEKRRDRKRSEFLFVNASGCVKFYKRIEISILEQVFF